MTKEVSTEHSAMAVVFYQGNILVTEEDIYGRIALSLPKGHLEADEMPTEAAIRECCEETNVVITKDDVVTELESFKIAFTRPDGQEVVKIITPILFKTNSKGNPKPLEKRVKKVYYMSVNEFLTNCSYDNVKQVVQSALKFINN